MRANAIVAERKAVLVWKNPVDSYIGFMALLEAMRKIAVIGEFFENHTLVNREITHNACYDLEIFEDVTYVYLKMQ